MFVSNFNLFSIILRSFNNNFPFHFVLAHFLLVHCRFLSYFLSFIFLLVGIVRNVCQLFFISSSVCFSTFLKLTLFLVGFGIRFCLYIPEKSDPKVLGYFLTSQLELHFLSRSTVFRLLGLIYNIFTNGTKQNENFGFYL